MKEIWKLQRPLYTNSVEGGNEILAYTQYKKRQAFIEATESEVEKLFGDEFKIYVVAKVKKGILNVHHKVEDQEW